MLRVPQPGPLPGAAAVATPVDPVAPGHVPPAHVLARPHPHDVRIGRIDGDIADGIGRLVVENGRPGDARVRGLPDATGSNRDVPGGGVLGVDRDVGDAAAHQRRADPAQREALGGLVDDGGVGGRGLGGLRARPRRSAGREGQGRDRERRESEGIHPGSGQPPGGDRRREGTVESASDRGAVHARGLGCGVRCGGGGRRVRWKWIARGWSPQGGGTSKQSEPARVQRHTQSSRQEATIMNTHRQYIITLTILLAAGTASCDIPPVAPEIPTATTVPTPAAAPHPVGRRRRRDSPPIPVHHRSDGTRVHARCAPESSPRPTAGPESWRAATWRTSSGNRAQSAVEASSTTIGRMCWTTCSS